MRGQTTLTTREVHWHVTEYGAQRRPIRRVGSEVSVRKQVLGVAGGEGVRRTHVHRRSLTGS